MFFALKFIFLTLFPLNYLNNSLPNSLTSLNLLYFKIELKSYLKPDKIKHFRVGKKETNSLLTRFRTGRTDLNAHTYILFVKYRVSQRTVNAPMF